MARIKYFDKNTGKWEYADSQFVSGGNSEPTYTGTYNDGDTVTLSNVQKLVLHGKTYTENSKNLCSLSRAEVVTGPDDAYLDFDIEEIPAGVYSISAQMESTADTENYSIILLDASGSVVLDAIVTEVNSTDGRAYVVNRTVERAFSKLRLYAAQGWTNSLNQTTIWSDIQIEANTENTAYEPYYKASNGIPAEVSFNDIKFSADAKLLDGDRLNFANGVLTRNNGASSIIRCNGSINALNGEYKISSKGMVTITASQTPPIGVTTKAPTSNVRVVDNCQDLGKWTAVLGTMTADTEDYLLGVQSIQFNHRIQITVPSVSLKNRQIRVKFKVNSWGEATTLLLYVTNDNFAHHAFATLAVKQTTPEKNIVKEGEWVELTVPTSAFREADMSAMTGVSTFRLTTNNANCSINVQQISVVGEPTGNGIISFTFDDGHKTNITKAAPILAERGIAATAYIIPDSVGVNADVMTENQVTSLKYDYGWDVEAHFMSKLTDYSEEDLDEMFAGVREWIQSRGLGEGKHLAYPNGFFNSSVEKVARKYFTTSRTIDISTLQGLNSLRFSNPQRLAAITAVGNSYGGYTVADIKTLIDRVANVGGWLILVFHIIDDEIATSGEYCTSTALGEIADYAVASGVEIRTIADALS